MNTFIFKIDHYVANLFHKIYLWGGETATKVMELISYIAEAGILFLILGLAFALFPRTRKVGVTILLSIALGFLFTNIILKPLIGRARPFENISSDFFSWWLDAGSNYESGYSFPSGHTTATTAFAVAILLTTNKKYSSYILLLPIAMASSRIYLMVHYFSDCLGGIIVGTVVATLAFIIVKLAYSSNAKLFIWIREFNVFKPKTLQSMCEENPEIKKIIEQRSIKSDSSQKVEELVYLTQEDENKNNNNLSQNDTKTSENNDNNNISNL